MGALLTRSRKLILIAAGCHIVTSEAACEAAAFGLHPLISCPRKAVQTVQPLGLSS